MRSSHDSQFSAGPGTPLLTLSLSCSTFITSAAIMAFYSSPSCLRPEAEDVSPPLPVLLPSDCQVNFLLGFPFSPSSYLDIHSSNQLVCGFPEFHSWPHLLLFICQANGTQRQLELGPAKEACIREASWQHKPLPDVRV